MFTTNHEPTGHDINKHLLVQVSHHTIQNTIKKSLLPSTLSPSAAKEPPGDIPTQTD